MRSAMETNICLVHIHSPVCINPSIVVVSWRDSVSADNLQRTFTCLCCCCHFAQRRCSVTIVFSESSLRNLFSHYWYITRVKKTHYLNLHFTRLLYMNMLVLCRYEMYLQWHWVLLHTCSWLAEQLNTTYHFLSMTVFSLLHVKLPVPFHYNC